MRIEYTTKLIMQEDLHSLYESLGWNSFLQLNQEQLAKAMEQSWYVIYAYDGEKLVATGRVVSDGIINAYVCGLGVIEEYRNKGIGTEFSKRLMDYCKNDNVHIQLFCEEKLVSYYEKMGFKVFTIGMKVKEE
ncbi:GNAT family N-acetyltransferase [Clostridium botulinum]|uniref:GNAT family N-acetyltransferase n=1 Tax=Clostridium botulinum TaxID=1491 RepID=A0A846JBM3_CLOBO|nr:GNAT family N-acetyltransferase [Clostridium botulinum]ACA53596.1 ribosomal-protein-alanine acetyltransferase [Clostridium botulinum A3 str. Loch Maree]NFH66058.1 GNAT family N-acetyltransferase [Clostridium botulinum]NFJ09263.1 GNAT family N-acetyltransferase [Clostridium botulinum]NFK13805.1 GNAT family N-acetyltransferase [Clostridium botulinum]NFM95536.1 GNAT family N-acetyltransferase [Clostridium botulinum]